MPFEAHTFVRSTWTVWDVSDDGLGVVEAVDVEDEDIADS